MIMDECCSASQEELREEAEDHQFTAVAGLDTPTQLAASRGFTRLGWWDNTGVLSLSFSPQQGWMRLMTDIQHLQPDYFSFMPSGPESRNVAPRCWSRIPGLCRGRPGLAQCDRIPKFA
jgi:hypothetical protein